MFKIGEFSKLTQVSIRMLRYYDELDLFKPAQIDKLTGYRLYSAEQIPVLNKIIFLRDVGFTVAEIAIALEHWDCSYITDQLQNKRLHIEKTINDEQRKIDKIKLAIKDIEEEKLPIHYNVTIKNIPSCQVLSLRRTLPTYYAEGQLWKYMVQYASEHQISLSSSTFSIYHDNEYKERDVDVELCSVVEEKGRSMGEIVFRSTEPIPMMACTMIYGSFDHIAEAYRSFAKWLQESKQYQMYGQNRQIVHRGPWNEDNPANYLTEIQIPIQWL